MTMRKFLGKMALSLLPLAVLAAAPAAVAADIVVGQIGPFTVLPAPDPKELNEGITAAFNEINGRGGIQGRKLSLITLDDAYSYDGFRTQLSKLMESKPVALLAPLGSATLKGVLDNKLLDTTDIIILNAVPGASILREPGHPKFFHIRAGDEEQIAKIVKHAQSLTLKTMGVLYQSIPMGSSGLASARRAAAESENIKILDFPSSPAPDDLARAAAALAKENLQSALVIGAPKFAGEGIAALRAAGVSQQIFTLSYLPAAALTKFAGQDARGVAIAQTFPNPAGIRLQLQRDFRAAMKKAFPAMATYTTFHMEGYVTAKVFAEAARQSNALTPSGIAQALRTMGEIDLGGFRVDFSKSNVGSHWVDVGVVSRGGNLLY